jgi:hypothetical protein
MRSITVKDLDETIDLDQTAMAGIAGGMDVKIENVSSTIRNTDDNFVLSADLLGTLVNRVIDGIRQQSQKGGPRSRDLVCVGNVWLWRSRKLSHLFYSVRLIGGSEPESAVRGFKQRTENCQSAICRAMVLWTSWGSAG